MNCVHQEATRVTSATGVEGASLQRPPCWPSDALVAVYRGPGRIQPQKEGGGALSSRLGGAGCLGEQVSSGVLPSGCWKDSDVYVGPFPSTVLWRAPPLPPVPLSVSFLCGGGWEGGGQSLRVPLATSLSAFPLPPWDGLVTELSSLSQRES